MSGIIVNTIDPLGVGFYGKIPVLGDFVSRGLPRSFIDPWDQWLQACLRSSREMLGEDWLATYLVSPVWRFALSPGVCNPTAWAGVIMPSVDRVGRYYPLTLAQNIDVQSLGAVFLPGSDWFDQLESLALSVLSETFDFEAFAKAAQSLQIDRHLVPLRYEALPPPATKNTAVKQACRYDTESLEKVESIFPGLCQNLIGKLYSTYSFWAGTDGNAKQSRFVVCEGLPPIDAYAGFLTGLPDYAGWSMQAFKVNEVYAPPLQNDDFPPETIPEQSSGAPAGDESTRGWSSFGMTVVGNKRTHNEDALLNCPDSGMWVVADGMGGHQSGDVASRLIVDKLAEVAVLQDIEAQIQAVSAGLNAINSELCRFAAELRQGSVVGSTVVTLLAKGGNCAVIWAGDSRLYRFRRGRFSQVTRDHTLLDEMMETTGITKEEAMQKSGANVITRAVGGNADLRLDIIRFTAEPGDRYLLCSDGLDKELSETEIGLHMLDVDCRTIVENLINHALDHHGRDNITVVAAEFL